MKEDCLHIGFVSTVESIQLQEDDTNFRDIRYDRMYCYEISQDEPDCTNCSYYVKRDED